MTDEVTKTPTADDLERFRTLMGEAQEAREDANSAAGDARGILKGLGFSPASIAMYKRLTDPTSETGAAVFDELRQLLNADPAFPWADSVAPNMIAHAAGKEAKKPRGRPRKPKESSPDTISVSKGDGEGALAAARQHLGDDESSGWPQLS